tara:strand:- start:18193 stop:19062 length:870 start_codon:yes stop_codon:yes gene_type:complete
MTVSKAALFCALQRLLPHHLLSRLLAPLAESRINWLKTLLIKAFIRHYQVDVSIAERTELKTYSTFNDFFTRALKPGTRPIAETPIAIVSPADGAISQCGTISAGELIQAKGHRYHTADLLGDKTMAEQFSNGVFATIYLSPRDYHRVHIPVAGKLRYSRYIPGRLFSVNHATTAHQPGLFTRNERLVCVFESERGAFVVVMVGAMLVAGIETVWQRNYRPGQAYEERYSGDEYSFAKGDEIGRFKFGSTAIVLLPNGTRIDSNLKPGKLLKMGEVIAHFTDQETPPQA